MDVKLNWHKLNRLGISTHKKMIPILYQNGNSINVYQIPKKMFTGPINIQYGPIICYSKDSLISGPPTIEIVMTLM